MSVGVTTERLAVGIVADDLTGANDSAVQFARAGWHASLGLVSQPGDVIAGGAVLALVSDSRAQDAETAVRSTISAVDTLRFAGATRLFVKIDSTMRGSVQAQIDGAITSWSVSHPDAFAVVCPAYPGMGRTVEDGRVLVNGAGVETTAIGVDPVTPVTSSELSVLLPSSTRVSIRDADAATAALRITDAVASGARVIVIDATTDEELGAIARTVAELGPRAIATGAAGLAIAMSTAWAEAAAAEAAAPAQHGDTVESVDTTEADDALAAAEAAAPDAPATRDSPAGCTLFVISSLHDVSRTQLTLLTESLAADELLVLQPSLERALDSVTIADWAREQLAQFDSLPRVVVVATPEARAARTDSDADTREAASVTIATSLAAVTNAVFEHGAVGPLVLVGGEGARAVLERLGARAIRIEDTIREGIPLGTITDGIADGHTVVTKAGGFGEPAVLAELATELTHRIRLTTRIRGAQS